MTLETLPDYAIDAPEAGLPHSRLYPLVPIGVGSGDVESLTSYLTRLAHAHGVTVENLAVAEIAPVVNKSARAARAKFSIGSRNLNGMEGWTALTLTALTALTLRDDLASLTMHPWHKAISPHHLLRHHLAWCPACYTQWRQTGQPIYIPLLWSLKPVLICPHHQQPLRERCPYPDCNRQLRLINSRVKPGYCPYCHRWLGVAESSPGDNAFPDETERQWQHWLTDQLTRLLASPPTLAAQAKQQGFVRNIKRCVDASARSSVHGLAHEMGLSTGSFFSWIHRGHRPQLASLARVCRHLDISIPDMLTAQPGQPNDPLPPPEAREPTPVKMTVDTDVLRHRLAQLLADPHLSPGSASRVARQLEVTPNSIKRYCPDLYQQILKRHAQDRQTQRQARNQKLAHELQAVLDDGETPPPSMGEVARRLRINPRTARANCPDLCRAISNKRKTYYETREVRVEAALREILAASGEPPPSTGEIATRLNQNVRYLYEKFPDLCRAVTRRHRQYQLPPMTQPLKTALSISKGRDHTQLRQQFLALMAAETAPPLSLAEVSRRLGCGITTLRRKHSDLCRQLRQQGDAYRRQQDSILADRLRHILARNEATPPAIRTVAGQLEVNQTLLKRRLPDLYAEVIRRRQAYRQAERDRRQAVLARIISENSASPPSLSRVALSLGCEPSVLQRQFPALSAIIVDRYRVYRKQKYATAQAALEAALRAPQPLRPFQVAQQLGHESKSYLQNYFPELCHQLSQRYETHRQQMAQAQLATVLAEPMSEPPLSLVAISRQLGYHSSSLRYLCPDLCQVIEQRYQLYWQQKKQAVREMLEAILNGDRVPISPTAVARECGYSLGTIQCHFPELTQAVSARYKRYVRERGAKRRRQIDEEVQRITRSLFEAGIDPKLNRVIARLPSPGAAKEPHVRQAWREMREALGLPTRK